MQLGTIRSVLATPIDPKLEHDEYKLAAVMIIIYDQKPTIIMTEKSRHLKQHAGEISFPGGKMEDNDPNLLHTALRETHEEIGLVLDTDQIVGQLEPVMTANSGFVILPFVSIVDSIDSLQANSEVEEIFHISLSTLLNSVANNFIDENYPQGRTFVHKDKIIWGASARMINQILNKVNKI